MDLCACVSEELGEGEGAGAHALMHVQELQLPLLHIVRSGIATPIQSIGVESIGVFPLLSPGESSDSLIQTYVGTYMHTHQHRETYMYTYFYILEFVYSVRLRLGHRRRTLKKHARPC